MNRSFILTFFVVLSLYALSVEKLFPVLTVLLFCGICMYERRCQVTLFPGTGIYLLFFEWGMAMGAYNMFMQNCGPRQIMKDVVYVLFPLLFWFLGKYTGLTKGVGITNLFIAGVVVSGYDLANSLLQIFPNGGLMMSLYQFRSMIGTGHPLTVITLFLYLYMPQDIKIKKKRTYGCIGILLADMLIHFSRLNLLNTGIFLIYMKVLKKLVKYIPYVSVTAAGLASAYRGFPAVFRDYIERLANSLTEISYLHDPWNHVSIVTNWRGYEVYCELQKFRQAGMIEKIFGGGFGAQLDVHGKAYLVTTEPTLPFLHNGYFTILMIWGICGCAAYFLMLLVLYRKNRTLAGKEKEFWKALTIIIAINTLFVHGMFFSASAAGMFLYLGALDKHA